MINVDEDRIYFLQVRTLKEEEMLILKSTMEGNPRECKCRV